jgi:sec-independent protein translocase protein TatA
MGDIGVPELLIILAIVIIVFGPARIGGVGKSLGEAIRSFRHEVRDETERTAVVEKNALMADTTLEIGDDAPTAKPVDEREISASFAETVHAHE